MSTPTTVSPTTTVEESSFHRFVVQFRENKLAVAGLILMILLAIPAFAAPWIAPQNPYDIGALDILDSQMPPGSVAEVSGITYWLGTDSQARDVLSAVLYGMRTSLLVAFSSVTVSLLIGSTVGLCAAYFGGWLDALLMRIVDIQLSFPAILVALVMLSVLGQGLDKVIIALIIVQWAYFARTVRGTALVERNREYVLAARCLSLGWRRIIARHLLPNCLPPLIVIATIDLANAIALEATLSFLGVGVPVTQPSLGMLIANGFEFMLSGQYWISFFPGIALALAIVGINLVGDHLRDILNPRNAL
ncbi:ABC transporter permease [Neorhizobium galegae]|uniref:Dipeptide transport system permease protein (ABC superfamily, membrane) n=1 Tax=Neorhizobium galegae bv. officinalis TaxID=323656 RepID=A0A0T7H5V8_NEOGA|nr:ABC transporter permease [Neorhizobium galegae]CDZ54912.1 Dipeptide transport system permease protein (ABC superfamily, membrane) [Neorhizobium galegae bv. officinalis]